MVLSAEEFVSRRSKLKSYDDLTSLLNDSITQENEYRGLFSQQRDSWEVPEVLDPCLGLVDVYENVEAYQCLPQFTEDTVPRCFELKDKRLPVGTCTVWPKFNDFSTSWEVFSEGQLRYLDWSNVFAAGGSVAGCLAPVPAEYRDEQWGQDMKKRRTFFHDVGFPGSDVDLFLYGLDAAGAEKKLMHIFEAVQAANPHEVVCFRSAHAMTLVSQYPFRHIQVVLRLYNSPAEVLMGFDVDACACGFDGKRVMTCMRTALAFARQANTVDMTRRSPSYEMRLSKYAERGFEVVVPALVRERLDPFIYEKRFDQVQGLSRLLLLERLRTPEARFRYRQNQRLKKADQTQKYRIMRDLRKGLQDKHTLVRMDGELCGGAEVSSYSTVFLPWGPTWNAARIRKIMRKKDHILNHFEFQANGRAIPSTRKYKLHLSADGTMHEVIEDPFPDDPPIPATVPDESLQQCVRGRVSWITDNPGRQQIGSFHPITDGDWTHGAFLSSDTEEFIIKCAADDVDAVCALLDRCGSKLLTQRDFLGRTALHVGTQGRSIQVCEALLAHPAADAEMLQARLADGRLALHLAAVHGFDDVATLILSKRKELATVNALPPSEILDIDSADWEVKLSPLQYSVVLGHVDLVKRLLLEGADVAKPALHKDKEASLGCLSLCASFAQDSMQLDVAEAMLDLLLDAGASFAQVDLKRQCVWHLLSASAGSAPVLELFLRKDPNPSVSIDLFDDSGSSPLSLAAMSANAAGCRLLLAHGAHAILSEAAYAQLLRSAGGAQSRHSFGQVQNPGEFRAPMFLAAKRLDVETLRAFLEHDPSLANAELEPPISNGRFLSGPKTTRRLLDIVEEFRTSEEEGHSALAQKQLLKAKAAVEVLDASEGSFVHNLWRVTLRRCEMACSLAEPNVEDELSPDERKKRLEAHIDAAVSLVQKYGGERHPKEAAAESHETRGRLFRSYVVNLEPLVDFGEATAFEKKRIYHHRAAKRIPKAEAKMAVALFEAVYSGDAAATQHASRAVPVCTLDASGASPLWHAVARSDVECVRALYNLAKQQFQLPVQKAPEESQNTDVSSQIRCLNNLEIAAGTGRPLDKGPTVNEMRHKLDELQRGVAAPEDAERTTTRVQPEQLLLTEATVFIDSVPGLGPLVAKIRDLGNYARKNGQQTCNLSAIELAVVRKDIPMVLLLLEVAGAKKRMHAVEEDSKNEDGASDHEGDEGDEGDEEDVREPASHKEQPKAVTMQDLREVLFVKRNRTLGGLPLLHLALLVDDPTIFMSVAAFAREFSFPFMCVDAWRVKTEGADTEPARAHMMIPTTECATLLQCCLWFRSKRTLDLLLTGEADDTLFGWILSARSQKSGAADKRPIKKVTRASMRRFLVESDFSTVQEFAQHFLGPSALDADGRSVLFYTSAEDVPRLVAAGANLEQRDDADFTPLMAAAYKCDVPLVSALLEAGCNLTALGGKAVKRNAVHFAIMAHQKELNKETQTSPVEAVVGVLLEKATAQKNMDELLAVPGAEHTPFMLAAQIGAPEAVVRTLAKHSPAESLIRRDSQLKTALHLSVTRVPEPAIKSFEAVLEATGTCTSMEDARGCTPYDAAKNTVTASVWKAPSKPQRAHTRRVEWPAKDEAHESVSAWQCCGHLHEAIRSVPGHRTLASFEEVQEAAKGAAEKAQADEKAAAAPYHHNRSTHTEQVSPADVNLLDIMWSRGSDDFPMMS